MDTTIITRMSKEIARLDGESKIFPSMIKNEADLKEDSSMNEKNPKTYGKSSLEIWPPKGKRSFSFKNLAISTLLFVPSFLWRSIGVCGVVYGDIGTSPIYTQASTFTSNPNWIDVLGSMSLLFYTFVILVIFKYTLIVTCFDMKGEGGIHILSAVIRAKKYKNKYLNFVKNWFLIIVSIVGSSFCLGDGVYHL
jgi:hypothetical protein